MPHALLSVQDLGGLTLTATVGVPPVYLPRYRLLAWVRLGNDPAMRQAVVDTGAPACILAHRIWSRLHSRGDITWIAHPPGATAGGLPSTAILGAQHPFRLGRVRLQLADFGDGQLTPHEVLAICTEDASPARPLSPPLIIGLAEVMNGRSLLLQVSESGARWVALVTEP